MKAKFRMSILILTTMIISSCSSTRFKNKDLNAISANFSMRIVNQSIVTDSLKTEPTLSSLFQIQESIKNDSLFLEIYQNDSLRVTYKNILGGKEVRVFKGKFKKHYYQVFTERKQIIFPPIYWTSHINRLRFSVSKDSLLIVNNYVDSGGMIMFIGNGYTYNSQYCFKIIK